MIFQYPIKIRESHLDTFGHVNNAVYLEIFEEARWEIINSRGYGIEEIKQNGHGPVVLEIHLKFVKELRLHDKILVHSKAESYSGKIGIFKQWIENESHEICCEAQFKIGLFDIDKRKLIAPTEAWLNAIGVSPKP